MKRSFLLWLLLAALAWTRQTQANSFELEFAPNSGNWLGEHLADPNNPNANNSSISFVNTPEGPQLVLRGPDGNLGLSVSDEIMTFLGAGGNGVSDAGTVQFHWSFAANNTLAASASFLSDGLTYSLASGELGSVSSGDFSMALDRGTQFVFDLHSEIYKGQGANLVVSDFHFTPTRPAQVPDSSNSLLLLGLGLLVIGANFEWLRIRDRKQAAGAKPSAADSQEGLRCLSLMAVPARAQKTEPSRSET